MNSLPSRCQLPALAEERAQLCPTDRLSLGEPRGHCEGCHASLLIHAACAAGDPLPVFAKAASFHTCNALCHAWMLNG